MKNKYTRKVILSLGLGLLGSVAAQAQQKIGANPGTLNPGAVLELEANNKGFLLPRISIPNLGAWGLPGTATEGMMVYNNNATTGTGYYVWSGGAWTRIATGASAPNIYNTNGTLTSNRVVTLGGNSLTFRGNNSIVTFEDTGNFTGLRLIRLAGQALESRWDLISGIEATTAFGVSDVTSDRIGNNSPFIIESGAAGNVLLGPNGSLNVGIGTRTPTQRLHVAGGALISSLAGTGSRMVVADAAGVLSTQAIPAAQTLTLAGNTLSISGGNSVTLPTATNLYTADGTLTSARTVTLGANNLTINGTGAGHFAVTSDSTSNSINTSFKRTGAGTIGISFEQVGIASYGIGTAATSGDFVFRNNWFDGLTGAGVEQMRIARATGNLGIGTSAPSQRLHVVGGALISSLAGTGSRMVVADAAGVLSTQALPVNTDAQTLTLAGNTLSISGGNSVTLPSATNIYNADGALTASRTVSLGANSLTFAGTGSNITNFNATGGFTGIRITRQAGLAGETSWDLMSGVNVTTSFGISDVTGNRTGAASPFIIQSGAAGNVLLLPNASGNVGIGTQTPTSTLDVEGSIATSIRRITAARTLDATDHTIIANAFAAPFTVTLPAPSTCTGRVYVIRKVDESSNALTFTFTGITGTNAIRVSDSSATVGVYMNSLNYTRTIRIQSDGTDWYMID